MIDKDCAWGSEEAREGEPVWLGMKELQERLGRRFNDLGLLDLALTHSSWANDHQNSAVHNERLEFLGDSVLGLCVSSELYSRDPQAREGELTRMRSGLVDEGSLAALARRLGLPALLKLGKGEEAQGGRDRDSVLADAMEAVIAALYLDGGFMAARQAVKILYKDAWPEDWRQKQPPNNKSRLQELARKLFQALPIYELEGCRGPAHAPAFDAIVRLPDGRVFRGSGPNRKWAEQSAAGLALEEVERSE